MKRPKLKIKRDGWDYDMETVSLFATMATLLPLWYASRIAQELSLLPYRFGMIDMSAILSPVIWFLPFITFSIYFGLTWLEHYPHVYNYPVTITSQNYEIQYKLGVKLLRCTKLFVTMMFRYMALTITGILPMSYAFSFIFLFLILVFSILFMVKMYRNR
ncbi:MAG: hypothetical protein LUD15_02195 [Bacteroides sp.]|nr:hypothetical protein [Bacteroides sp.]